MIATVIGEKNMINYIENNIKLKREYYVNVVSVIIHIIAKFILIDIINLGNI